MNTRALFTLLIILNLGFASSLKDEKPLVSVSIPPQAYFVRQIAADSLKINVLIPSGTDEHNFDFKPSVMKELENSDIYFGIGLELEKVLINRFKNLAKNLHFVDTGARLRTRYYDDVHSHHDDDLHAKKHSHHDDDLHADNSHTKKHSHRHDDPHIWLDPLLVKDQAELIASQLIATYPQNKALYEANLAKFKAELDALHAQISSLLAHKKGKKFIVYHPSWGYFAARYHLVQIPVEFEGKEPKPKDLQKLIRAAKKENIRTIFIQKGFPQAMAKNLAKELNANVVEINHLSEDWHNELLKSAKNLGLE